MTGNDEKRIRANTRPLQDIFRNSNLTLRCQDQKWKVYRFVVCEHKYFEVLVDPDPQTCHENLWNLYDDDPETVNRMLTWEFTLDYNDEPAVQDVANVANNLQSLAIPGIQSEDSSAAISSRENTGIMQSRLARAMINIDVCSFAEKYKTLGLQKKAIEKCSDQQWSTWTHDELALLSKKISDFSTPRRCKALFKKAISDYADRMFDAKIQRDQTCAIENLGDFACDLCQELRTRELDGKIASLQAEVIRSEFDESVLKTKLRNVQCERDIAVRQRDLVVSDMVEHDSCRQCGARFGAYLRSHDFPSFPFYVACKTCHTLH